MSNKYQLNLKQNILFSQVHKEHSLGYTTPWATNQALEILRKLKLYQSIFSDPNAIRLEINHRGKNVNTHTHTHTHTHTQTY